MDVYGKIWNERRMVIRERVLEEVPPGAELEDETLQAMIDRTITELFPDEYIRLEEKRKLRHMVFNSIRRMDVLQDVLEDETITEIMVNGPHHIFVEQAGRCMRRDFRLSIKRGWKTLFSRLLPGETAL